MYLNLVTSQFEHIPQNSVYNNNCYKNKELGYTIRETCQDDSNECSYYLIEDGREIFLGDSQDGGLYNTEEVKIYFKQYFT